jgi:hypothetical protein
MRKLIGLLGASALTASLLVGTTTASADPASIPFQAKAKSKMSLSLSAPSFVHGKDGAVVSVTVKSGGKNAAGKVAFYDGKKKLKTLKLKAGKAKYRLPSSLAVGSHTVKATYQPKSKKVAAVSKKASVQVFSLSLYIDAPAYVVYQENYAAIQYTAEFSGSVSGPWLDFWLGGYRPGEVTGDKMMQLENQGTAKKFVSSGTYWWMSVSADVPGVTTAYQVSFTPQVSAADAVAIADFTMTVLPNVLAVGTQIVPGNYRLPPSGSAFQCSWTVKGLDGTTTASGRAADVMPVTATDATVTFQDCGGGPIPV